MVDTSKKSRRLDSSLYQGLHWTRCSVLTVMLVLLIGTGDEMRVDCSFVPTAKAVVDNFYSRFNITSAVDLVFVLDRSGSVNRGAWKQMITFVKNLLDPFLIDKDHARVAMVMFNSNATIAFNDLKQDMVNKSATKCSVYRQLRDLVGSVGLSGHTATDAALSKAFQILQNARPDTKKAVVLITDGDSNVGNPPRTTSLLIQHLKWGQKWNSSTSGPQVEIFAFGIANVTAEFLLSVVSDLPDHFSHFPNFDDFSKFTERIQKARDNIEDQWRDVNMANCLQMCDQLNSKCMCGAKRGQFSCACRPGYEAVGSTCKACQIGYYKDVFIPGVCRQCPQNSTTSAAGATNSSSCHPLPGHQKCRDLPNIEHGGKFYVSGTELKEVANTGRDCKDVHDGNSCHYECDTGYRLLNGTKVMTCNPWGRWDGAVPRCEIVDCGRISDSWVNATHVTLKYANRTTYGSVISASCHQPGFMAFGPTVWTCGEHATWNGKSSFQCKEVHCGALTPIAFADVVPADCATTKKRLGFECQMICWEGFQHMGPGNFTCSFKNGTFWKPRAGEKGQSKCHDVQAPTITCPPNITIVPIDWKNCTIIDFTKDQPKIYDNSLSWRHRILPEPENDTFCVGHTHLTYEAYDETNNTMKCDREVHVIAKTVDIISCPNNITMTVNSSNRSRLVSWPEPIFHGSSGERLPTTCRPANGSVFKLGVERVVCFTPDYPSSICEFKVHIIEPPCLPLFPDRMPSHGQVVCNQNIPIYAKGCSVKCHDGYEFISDEPETHSFCRWDGSWTKNEIWPQCYSSRHSNHAQSLNHLLGTINGSTCDEQKRIIIMDSFNQKVISILSDKLGPCMSPYNCSLVSVNLNCTDKILRSRRSDASLPNATSATESIDSDVHVEILMGNFSLSFVIRATLLNGAANHSSVTKSKQEKIADILDEIFYNMTQTIRYGQFTWMAEGHLVTAIDLVSDGPKFDLNCASNEVIWIRKKSAACFTCTIGTYYHNGSCNPCPIGSYKDRDGGEPCTPCNNSGSTASEGARSSYECLDPCLPGFSSLTGYENCTACLKGSYQSEIRSKFCHRCPDKQTTSSIASTTIHDCYEPVSCVAYKKTCGSHGSCIRKQEVVLCLCDAGFSGLECESNINECERSQCENNGTCIDQIDAYDCNCSSSFTGERCEIEVDECTPSPCENGGTCVDNRVSYDCVCPQGFSGIHCKTDIDECASNPCQFGGTCQDGLNGFNCTCLDNYAGLVCDRQRDFCSNVTCYNGGKCIASNTMSYCSCLKGYTGTNCESEIEACASSPCQNNSTCIGDAGSFRCLCPPGFIGDTCADGASPDFDLVFPKSSTVNYVELRLKLSESSSLRQVSICAWMRYSDVQNSGTIWSYATNRNGYFDFDYAANVLTARDSGNLEIFVNGEMAKANISLNDGNWHHLCFVWSSGNGEWILYLNGTRRQQGSNLAEGTLIKTNGNLILGQKQNSFGDSFNSDGNFIGELTQFSVFSEMLSDADITAMASIKSGACELGRQGNVVSWTDVRLNIHGNVAIRDSSWCNDVNECQFTNLNNCTDGTCCKDVLGSFICVKCEPPGCANVKCQNGGTCKMDASGSYCECTAGYTGSNCEEMKPTCSITQCMNGGTCNRQTGKCSCVKPWIGDYCKVQSLVKCNAQPCANGGTCVDRQEDGYRCECPPSLDFTFGRNCEIMSVCASSPCKSGGTCVITGATYLCECIDGFYGQNCESGSPAVCQNVTCKNGGTCQMYDRRFKCNCTEDFHGIYCENPRDSKSSNATIYLSVVAIVIAILVVTIIVFAVICIYLQRKKIASTFHMPLASLSVSNETYVDGIVHTTRNRSTVQEAIYCEPVELLPYATSQETDRNSDSGTGGQTKQMQIRNSHQSIPLPPKPDDANSPALSQQSLASWNHATPPPPYSADVHAPVPPVRQLPNTSVPSTIQHSLADQPNCYFVPISDEEPDNPVTESAESAYLIPRQEVESQDAGKDNTAYLVPTIDNDTEDAGSTMAPASSTEVNSGSQLSAQSAMQTMYSAPVDRVIAQGSNPSRGQAGPTLPSEPLRHPVCNVQAVGSYIN